MVNRIVTLDRKSREAIEKAKQLKMESEHKIQDISAKKREEYINKAKLNIKIIEHSERIKANTKLNEVEKEYKKKLERLEKNSRERFDKWVEMITERVIG